MSSKRQRDEISGAEGPVRTFFNFYEESGENDVTVVWGLDDAYMEIFDDLMRIWDKKEWPNYHLIMLFRDGLSDYKTRTDKAWVDGMINKNEFEEIIKYFNDEEKLEAFLAVRASKIETLDVFRFNRRRYNSVTPRALVTFY